MTHPFHHTAAALLPAALTAAIAFAADAAADRIYRYDNHYSDRPLHSGFAPYSPDIFKRERMRSFRYDDYRRNRERYAPLVTRAANRYRLDRALLDALITVESAYDPLAESKAGAAGLMQLMPATARRYGVSPDERYHPQANIDAGSRHFSDLLRRFNNDRRLALAAYNAGENAVTRYGDNIPPFRETRRFVRKVMNQYRQYRSRR